MGSANIYGNIQKRISTYVMGGVLNATYRSFSDIYGYNINGTKSVYVRMKRWQKQKL